METILGTVALIGALGLAGSVLLLAASRAFAVKEDGRLEAVRAVLPGANCGSCGYAGCEAYARALLDGAPANACTVGGAETASELASILGVEAGEVAERMAFVACRGAAGRLDAERSFVGTSSCRAFSTLSYSSTTCPFGCLGFGDCVAACPFGAIRIVDGSAVVDEAACTGCGACASACPRRLVKLVDKGGAPGIALVACSSPMPAKAIRTVCDAGCIGCRKCEKACPVGAVSVDGGLARVDASLCTGCGACVDACPTGAVAKIAER